MRLHAQGWTSAYHDDSLTRKLAADGFRTLQARRLTGARETVEVLLNGNPLLQRGLGLGSADPYFSTPWHVAVLSGAFQAVRHRGHRQTEGMA